MNIVADPKHLPVDELGKPTRISARNLSHTSTLYKEIAWNTLQVVILYGSQATPKTFQKKDTTEKGSVACAIYQ